MEKVFITIAVFLFTCNIATANSIILTDRSTTVTYPHTREIEAPVAFAHIAEDILLVKDMKGHFYIPGKNFHNIPPLRIGHKYNVVISRPTELIWNFDPGNVKVPSLYYEHIYTTHFEPVEPTYSNMSFLVTGLPPEGEIGVFTESGICVGAAGFSNQDWVGVAAWADNPDSPEIEGAINGELLNLFLQDSTGKRGEYLEILEGDNIFRPDVLAVIRLINKDDMDDTFALSQPYPNPFCAVSLINVNLKDPCEIDLAIFDQNGKRASDITSGVLKAGEHRFPLNESRLSSGKYTIRLRYGKYESRRKMMLVK